MNWGLFCQIEVILLTIGLIVSFIISIRQNIKDNSFARRVVALGNMLNDLVESLKKKEEKK